MKYQTDFEYKKEIQFAKMQEIEIDTVFENQKVIVVNIDDQSDFLKKELEKWLCPLLLKPMFMK